MTAVVWCLLCFPVFRSYRRLLSEIIKSDFKDIKLSTDQQADHLDISVLHPKWKRLTNGSADSLCQCTEKILFEQKCYRQSHFANTKLPKCIHIGKPNRNYNSLSCTQLLVDIYYSSLFDWEKTSRHRVWLEALIFSLCLYSQMKWQGSLTQLTVDYFEVSLCMTRSSSLAV